MEQTTTHNLNLILFCQGDNNAIAIVYKQWVPELFLIAFRYLKSSEEAEDVVADCFEKLLKMPIARRKQKFIKEEINLKALLLVMVKNRSLDVIKTKNTRKRILDGIIKLVPTVSFNNANQTLTDENLKALVTCLPEKEKQILSLSMQGYTNQEIGNQVQLSEKTVANLLSIARKKVKELWKTFMD